MKTLFTILAFAALAVSANAQNLTRTLTNGITTVAAGATSNAVSTAILETKNHEEVAVNYRITASATNVAGAPKDVVYTWGASTVPSNLVAIATTTNSPTTTATGNAGGNIYIGSYRYFGLISIANASTNAVVTNSSPVGTLGQVTLQFKDTRNGN